MFAVQKSKIEIGETAVDRVRRKNRISILFWVDTRTERTEMFGVFN